MSPEFIYFLSTLYGISQSFAFCYSVKIVNIMIDMYPVSSFFTGIVLCS